MVKITVQDVDKKIENRFDLILIAARLARKMQISGKEILLKNNNGKCTVLALREIEKIFVDQLKKNF